MTLKAKSACFCLSLLLCVGCASYNAGQDAASATLKQSPFNLVGAWKNSFRAIQTHDKKVREISGPLTGKIYPSKLDQSYQREVSLNNYSQTSGIKLNPKNQQSIIDGDIWLGMPPALAKIVLGEPDDVNRTTNVFGVHEQCVYTCQHGSTGYYYQAPCQYLYFENDVLTTWQD